MINPYDDYEKLAKLLYPSIEASGNVYYGQTRKLTLDEILKKNDCGFKSYVQSHREPDDSPQGFKYTSTLEWKLGPISGSIPFSPDMYDSGADSLRYTFDNFPDTDTVELINFYDDEENCTIYPQSEYDGSDTDVKHLYREYLDGVLFAKYVLEIENNTVSNLIGSGNFKTYEKNITAVYQGICCTDFFDPTNPSNRDIGDRRFYITEVNGQVYLYIQICSDGIELDVPAVAYAPQPLTLKATVSDFRFRLEAQYDTSGLDPVYDLNGVYEYSINNGSWQTINSFHREEVFGAYWTVSDYISISEGDTISLRGQWREIYDYSHYVSIAMYSDDPNPSFEASGNITSMYEGYDTASGTDVQGIYAGLFEACNCLTKAPKIPVTKHVQPYMFYRTFAYCVNLREMPLLLSNETNSHCYESMFANCMALRETSVMSFSPSGSFCDNMFSGCTQLNKVICYSYDPYEMFDYSGWLNNTASVGEFFTINENGWTAGVGGIPSGWSVYEEPSYRREMRHYTSLELDTDSNGTVLSTGTDSQENGRGIISDESTLYNMEESFDESDSHNMGTFNKDGSYNQDIWGYKSFNGPVKFRNGIYGDNFSLVAYSDSYTRLEGLKLNCDLYVEGNVFANAYAAPEQRNDSVYLPVGATAMLCIDTQYYSSIDDISEPLTFTAIGDSITVTAQNFTGTLYYKLYTNDSWHEWPADGIVIEADNSIYIGSDDFKSTATAVAGVFSVGGNGYLLASGNIMSLKNKTSFPTYFGDDTADAAIFRGLFAQCKKLVTPPQLPVLGRLPTEAYESMFAFCESLKVAPVLPSLGIGRGLYKGMFLRCTGLEISPYIKITNIENALTSNDVNNEMFAYSLNSCTSLKYIYSDLQTGTSDTSTFAYWVDGITRVDGAMYIPSTFPSNINKPDYWSTFTDDDSRTRYTSSWVDLHVGKSVSLFSILPYYPPGLGIFQIQNIVPAAIDAGSGRYIPSNRKFIGLSVDSKFRLLSGWVFDNTSSINESRYAYVLAMRVK